MVQKLAETYCRLPAQHQTADRHIKQLAGEIVEHLAAKQKDIPSGVGRN